MEPYDDMNISHFQNDTKLEALARRAPSKNPTRPKKKRGILNLNLFLIPSFFYYDDSKKDYLLELSGGFKLSHC